ncbi:macro domain-containing protein [Vibrio sp. F74]|uniref:type II toxin-antitoxin system antitoxin DNA ADP-ribosyl glycohydrolase DarG n=1 Tax=Vibrio sp. F74 TaxID=700020 RepID=UPI0035F55A3A
MIKFTSGNMLKDSSEAIVNTVNCVGVMGKGLALQFKKAFPDNFKLYKSACDRKEVKIGEVFITESGDMFNKKIIVNFPTKDHWRGKSKYEYIESGLDDLVIKIREYGIKSIAIPPLGAGLGSLDWEKVKSMIIDKLSPLIDVEVFIYEPNSAPESKEMIVNTKTPNMTRGRALLLKVLGIYSEKGYECTKIEIQKLAYFLQESGVDLKLNYQAHNFGPYAENLNHVLTHIDGHFISGFGDRVSKSSIEIINDSLEKADEFLSTEPEYKDSIDRVKKLISGYETPLSIEVLATVHWVIKHEGHNSSDFDSIKEFIAQWNDHKASIKEKYLKKALIQLQTNCWV